MLKKLFRKLQKIPISIEIVHFFVFTILFDQFTRFVIFQKHISKFFLIFCIQNKKMIFSKKKCLYLNVNMLETLTVKRLKVKKIISENQIF